MKRVLLLGHLDLRRFLRDRGGYIWLFGLPLAFTWFMGFANRGPGDPANPRPNVRLENSDAGFLGRAFVDALGAQGLRVLDPTNRDDAPRTIIVPADFTARVLTGGTARVTFASKPDDGAEGSQLVELRVARALIQLNSDLLEHGRATAVTEDSLKAVRARPNRVTLAATFAGRRPVPAGFRQSVPGNLVMFLLMNLLIYGGATLAADRRAGALRRIGVHPVTHAELVFGKVYGLVLLGAAQILVLLLAGRLLFRVEFGDALPAVALTLLVYAWVAASLGVLIGSVLKHDDKIIGVCLLAALVMAALGGCWWPLEVVPDAMRTAARLVPTGWAIEALHQLITFGGGLAQAAPKIGVLALFGVAANAAALRWFRV